MTKLTKAQLEQLDLANRYEFLTVPDCTPAEKAWEIVTPLIRAGLLREHSREQKLNGNWWKLQITEAGRAALTEDTRHAE